jgi:heptosyltransferase-2
VKPLDPAGIRRILIRATNWVGDAVMSLPALRAVRARFPAAHIALLARPWVADVYAYESFADETILFRASRGASDFLAKWRLGRDLSRQGFDLALLFPNSFESAALALAAGIPSRAGYRRDGRSALLTHGVDVPERGSIPRHESFYYLELMRRLGICDRLPEDVVIRLEKVPPASIGLDGPVVGVSPGAAFGGAKRWLPERFAESATALARGISGAVAIFGTREETAICDEVSKLISQAGIAVRNFGGSTSLREFIELAAACRVFLTNDSGSMHIASALGIPTVTVFGATDHVATGPTGDRCRVVREPVECAPCLKRECPIDHRCMTRVTAERVAQAALELLK